MATLNALAKISIKLCAPSGEFPEGEPVPWWRASTAESMVRTSSVWQMSGDIVTMRLSM